MNHTKELLSIELSNLVPSPFNVRRHPTSQVEELAALIAAQGLLHNLIVTEQVVGRGRARKIKFAVVAGERRRRALLLLQQQGRLARSHEVLCELVSPERALEVSLAENSGREPMHPADEFEAFRTLIDEGRGVEDVAARFGVSVLTVQRRLKLSAVSPKLLALYRQDGINLDQLMALALTDDHDVQERAWFEAHPWDRTPGALRRTLTTGEIEAAGNALVRFVGIEAYEAAGGVVRRDLFDDEQSRFLSDPGLLQRLATGKLETLAGSLQDEGWAWVEARIDFDSKALRQFTRADHTVRQPTRQEQAHLDELASRAKELERQSEAMSEQPDWSAVEAECIDLEERDIAARCGAIRDDLRVWSTDEKAHAGVVVTVNREGDPEIVRGLVREKDRKAPAGLRRDEGRSSQQHPKEATAGGLAASTEVTGRASNGCSESLARRLAAHRTLAMQVMLSRNTTVALASLAHVFVQRVFGQPSRRVESALQITAQLSGNAMEAAADDLKTTAAWRAVEASKLAWKERLPEQPGAWMGWLIPLPQAELRDLLALNALPSTGSAAEVDAIADAVGLDMADWWEPTAQSYLNHVPKAQIVQALREAGPDLVDDGVASMKKEVLVVKAASRLAGKRWLPAPLRHPLG